MINGYDFPEISYFIQDKKLTGNTYTGSQGENFRYRLAAEDDKLKASVWYEDLCYEKCHIDAEELFELTNEDLVHAIEWIFSKKK
jgi:hypothetical protein